MIDPKILRRYPIFGIFSPIELEKIAGFSLDMNFEPGEIIFREDEPARALFILLRGSVELYFRVAVPGRPNLTKELYFDIIKPGEIFGISSLIIPEKLTSTARANRPSRVIRIEAKMLEGLCQHDEEMAYQLMRQVAKATVERLNATRLQLATAEVKQALTARFEPAKV